MTANGRLTTGTLRTSGRSMRPLIRDDSLITWQAAAASEVTPGDIIVFRQDNRLVAHRAIAVKSGPAGPQLRQKGDNQLVATWIPPDALQGKAVDLRRDAVRWRLDIDPRQGRLKVLVGLARLEAGVLDIYLRAKGRVGAWLKWPCLLLFGVFAPVRVLVMWILTRAYRAERVAGSANAPAVVADIFADIRLPGRGAEARGVTVGDWQSVLELAARHGLAPLLAQWPAARTGAGVVPPDLASRLKQAAYRAAAQYDAALRLAFEIDGILGPAAVPYAVLKGPYLYRDLYQGFFPRPSEDVDLLVGARDVPRTVDRLRAIGYTPAGGRIARSFLSVGHFHMVLGCVDGARPPIELHWSLVDRANLYHIPDAAVLARARDFSVGQRSFRVLAAADQFIYLCIHAAKHGILNGLALRQEFPAAWFCGPDSGNRLLWFLDLELFLDKHGTALDWRTLDERVRRWNVAGAVRDCLAVLALLRPDSPARPALDRITPGPGQRAGQSSRVGRLCRTRAGRRVLERAMRVMPVLCFRPVRILPAARLFFPSRADLMRYHGASRRAALAWLYVYHPFHMLNRLFSG